MSLAEHTESRSSTSVLLSIVPSAPSIDDVADAPRPASTLVPDQRVTPPPAEPRDALARIPGPVRGPDGNEPTIVRTPTPAPLAQGKAPKAPTPTPAPKRSRFGLVVAAGGGMLVGGGVVAVVGAILAVVGLIAAGGLLWWSLRSAPLPAPTLADTVNDVTPVPADAASGTPDDAPAAGEPEEATPATPATATPTSSERSASPSKPASSSPASGNPSGSDRAAAPAPAPSVSTPAPAAPKPAPATTSPAPAPATAPAPAPKAVPAASASGLVAIKILTDPPAARIVIDGTDRGRTPAKLEVEADTHQLLIEAGKATGTFTIDTTEDTKFCFAADGKKVARTSCD